MRRSRLTALMTAMVLSMGVALTGCGSGAPAETGTAAATDKGTEKNAETSSKESSAADGTETSADAKPEARNVTPDKAREDLKIGVSFKTLKKSAKRTALNAFTKSVRMMRRNRLGRLRIWWNRELISCSVNPMKKKRFPEL